PPPPPVLHYKNLPPAVPAPELRFNREWHIEIDRCCPKLIVFRGRIVFPARERMKPNRVETFFLATFHFGDVFLDADIGKYGNPHEPVRRDAAILLDKVAIKAS